jgi:MtrB/PioB family decaheme-associated outer membrane protein
LPYGSARLEQPEHDEPDAAIQAALRLEAFMKTRETILTRTVMAVAVLAAFAPARAQESDAAALMRPESSVRLGVGITPGNERDRTIWGQYNGMREGDTHLLLDLDYVRRNDETGLWTTLRGRNLGLDSRDAAATIQKQGDWRINIDAGTLTHREIRTINTGLTGAGTTNPAITRLAAPGTGSDLDFDMKRKMFGLSGDKWVSSNLQFEVAFKDEDKNGTRMWGRGYDCAAYVCSTTQNATNQRWAVIPVPEPVNFNTKQIDAKVNFTSGKLFLSGGYYGSFFSNANGNVQPTVPSALNGPTGVLTPLNPAVAGGTSLQNVLQLPMALYPDNQAHQVYASGNYAWTKSTHSTFKLAYTHATQDESFGTMGFTGAPAVTRTSLGGVVDTTLMQFGLTSRVTDKFNLLGNVRYEKRDDKTPIAAYNVENTVRWNNEHMTNEKLAARFEAGYRLPYAVRATGGIDFERINKELPGSDVVVGGITGLRGSTHEVTYRGELRRSVSETLIGAIGVSHAVRQGSNWYSLSNVPAQGLTYGNTYTYNQIYQRTGTFPFDVADRQRDKVRVTADWIPMERLSVQLVAEASRDAYDPPSQNGLRYGGMKLLSADAAYILSERWKLTAFGSVGEQTFGEADRPNYVADVTNNSTTWGVGAAGRLTAALEVGANISRQSDQTKYAFGTDFQMSPANVSQASIGLPPVIYSDTRYALYSKYALTKRSDLRLDLLYVQTRLEEWAWGYNGVPFTFSDNTTVTLNPHQHVTFLGASYIVRF